MPRFVILLLTLLLAWPAAAQIKCGEGMGPLERDAESRMSAQDFIKEVATNEMVFSKAFASYGYRLEVNVQTLDGDTVDGEYRRNSTVAFDANGQRRETVTEGPVNTLTRLKLGDRDFDTLREAFSLTASKVSDNDIVYDGRQKIGDINTAVFDILPRNQAADIRGFEGRVWVRARDNAIIHICGRTSASPIAPIRFDVVRAPVDEKYWFPVEIRADEDAHIGRDTVHVRLMVKYSDYKAR
jgi:hypothetical protein